MNNDWLNEFLEKSGWLENTKSENLMYLIEEIGEFAREVRRHEKGRDTHLDEINMSKEEMRDKLIEEAGDALVAFFTILKQYNVDFNDPLLSFRIKMSEK